MGALTPTPYAATSGYSCTAGDSLSGSTCTRSTAVAATPSYRCENGATLSGNQCTGTKTTKTAYIYLGGKQIAETVVGGLTQYVHTDALGSPVAHTNQARAELNRTKFEPYGYTAAGTKPGPKIAGQTTTESLIGFTGHVNDPQTDLVYMQQRYYDPIAGRFLSVDPVVTDANTGSSFNRYAYASNSPYKFVDPDGRNGVLALQAGAGGTVVCGPVCGVAAAGVVLVGGTYATVKIVNWIKSSSSSSEDGKRDAGEAQESDREPGPDGKRGATGGPGAGKRFPAESPGTKEAKEGVPCRYCDRPTTSEPGKDTSRERDHIDPRKNGGNNSPENEGDSCRGCNRSKGGRSPDDWKRPPEKKG